MPGTQEFTPIVVKGRNYRIGRIRPNVGAVLIRKIMAASGGDATKLTSVLMGGLSTEDEKLMQKELLSVVSFERQVGDVSNYVPVTDGEQIFDPSLKSDPVTMWALEQASFNENLAPFFSESGQKDVMAILAQIQVATSNSETSTDTSSAQ